MATMADDEKNDQARDRLLAQMVMASSEMYAALPDRQLVNTAQTLDDRRRNAQQGTQYRAALAASCIHIYRIVERRRIQNFDLETARGPRGFYEGLPESDAVFHMLDVWSGEAAQYHPPMIRHRRRRPGPVTINFDDDHPVRGRGRRPGPTGAPPSLNLEGLAADIQMNWTIGATSTALQGAAMIFVLISLAAGGPLTGPLGPAAAALSLGLAFREVDEINRFQGRVAGFADAIQQMSERYSDPTFDNRAYTDLPHPPVPRAYGNVGSRSEWLASLYREGEREGLAEAVNVLRDLQRQPRVIDLVDGSGAALDPVRMDGRLYLYLLNRRYGNYPRGVRRFVVSQIKARLEEIPNISRRWIHSIP